MTSVKHSAFSTNDLTNTGKTKYYYTLEQHKNLHNHATKLLKYSVAVCTNKSK